MRFSDIDKQKFTREVSNIQPPAITDISDIDNVLEGVRNVINSVAADCITKDEPVWNTNIARWERLLERNDPKYIWKAINWKGNIEQEAHQAEPNAESFKEHFETLLNPTGTTMVSPEDSQSTNCPYIPILDDMITLDEMRTAVVESNPDKSNDIQGVPPGAFKLFPEAWIQFLLLVFNLIMLHCKTPAAWIVSRLVVLCKKGIRLDCSNYRGISVNDSLYRLFDKILYRRLEKWFTPSREQAGAQKGRGCIEQILVIRLLCDYVKKQG